MSYICLQGRHQGTLLRKGVSWPELDNTTHRLEGWMVSATAVSHRQTLREVWTNAWRQDPFSEGHHRLRRDRFKAEGR